jgi:two-component system NtrC family sensor kinase
VIADTGTQVAYAGPFNLEGKDYSEQPWFMECQRHNACVSEIFSGYRDVPHIVVAVKSLRPDGRFFILRATLETERLIQTLVIVQDRGAFGHLPGQPQRSAPDTFAVL